MDPQAQLTLLRQNHRIVAMSDGQGNRYCRHDGVRVWPVKGGHRHDVVVMQRLNAVAALVR